MICDLRVELLGIGDIDWLEFNLQQINARADLEGVAGLVVQNDSVAVGYFYNVADSNVARIPQLKQVWYPPTDYKFA